MTARYNAWDSRIGIGLMLIAILLLGVCALFSSSSAEELSVCESAGEEIRVELPGQEQEEAAEGYIRKKMAAAPGRGLLRAPVLMGARLQDEARTLYTKLYPLIGQAAAGTITSTIFAFPAEEIYAQTTFTAAELGVEKLTENGAFTPEAKEAMLAKIRCFVSADIVRALQADCPYELYWYDKTPGAGCVVSFPGYSSNGRTIWMTGKVTFKMSVSVDYAAGEYQVDPSYGQAVQAAAENARRIVSENEALPDGERLRAYMDALCAMTAYHAEAAQGNWPYGNPWQLVWALDGDPATNVVCEGYAKAFQYLNDLSSGEAGVICVTGTMNGENHMWNIACMPDGKNYLVDVTNCDSGMAGSPDLLFLVGNERGSVEAGYTFAPKGRAMTYLYKDTPFSDGDLRLAAWDYSAGGPPTPEMACDRAEWYEPEPLAITWRNSGYGVDAWMARIDYIPEGEETERVEEKEIELSQDDTWLLSLREYGPGEICLQFAIVRDGMQSAWSSPVTCRMLPVAQFTPTYTVSTERGVAGLSAVIRLDTAVDGVVLDSGERLAMRGQDALLPLTEAGEMTVSLAVEWKGALSACGEAFTITVLPPAEGAALRLPAGLEEIEEEAFRGTAAETVRVPATVERVGALAFAGAAALRLVELEGTPELDPTAFDAEDPPVLCVRDVDWAFSQGLAFVVSPEDAP